MSKELILTKTHIQTPRCVATSITKLHTSFNRASWIDSFRAFHSNILLREFITMCFRGICKTVTTTISLVLWQSVGTFCSFGSILT